MSTKSKYRGFPLILSTNTQKADPETRKLIRSYVMRGKNRNKPSRKSKKVVCAVAPQSASYSTIDSFRNPGIPRILCSKFSAIGFAADIEPALIEDVLLFASMSSQAMFLLNTCIKPTTSDMSQIWFAPMLSDAAYLYTACFTIQAFFDGLFTRTRSDEALRRDHIYYGKTIKLIQERLAVDDDSIRLSDSTIMTVLTLSGHAYSTGDYTSADHHIRGLLKLVGMRGANTFRHNIRILIEIIRSDLSMAVDRCGKPMLFTYQDIPWNVVRTSTTGAWIDPEDCLDKPQVAINDVLKILSHDLADILAAASEFCIMVNAAAAEKGPRMTEEMFLHYMGSIMYRLLLQGFKSGSLDEALRLGLVAFLSPIFLNWNRVELSDRRFNSTYVEALTDLTLSQPQLQAQKRLWLFMIGALSMSHEPDNFAWLKGCLYMDLELCEISSWDDMKNLLSSFLWVGLVYDKPGKEIFDSILLERENRNVVEHHHFAHESHDL